VARPPIQILQPERPTADDDVRPDVRPDGRDAARPGAHPEPVPELVRLVPLETRRVDRVERPATILDLYERESVDLFRFVLASVHDRELAEDIVQESFLRLIRESERGNEPDNPRGWLYRVAVNLVINRVRRSRTAQRHLAALETDAIVDSPEDVAIDTERRLALDLALSELPTDARVALVMASQGFSAREIGIALHRSEGAVRSLTCRARLHLRALLVTGEVAPRSAR
jgi:RNA polymerase sigma-70 factor (ECF subfamily)